MWEGRRQLCGTDQGTLLGCMGWRQEAGLTDMPQDGRRVVQAAEFSVILSWLVSVENGHWWQHVKGFWQYNFIVSLEKNHFTAI